MKYVQPKPFFEEKGERAVLLLHGFTGNSADVRLLGRYLGERGYTTIAPHYAGHGVPPEQLIETGPRDWWRDVIDAYDRLKENGYTNCGRWLIARRRFFLKVKYGASDARCRPDVCADVDGIDRFNV